MARRGASCHTPPCYQFSVSGEDSNVVLNPTGGFKALVPFTVRIGMLKNVSVEGWRLLVWRAIREDQIGGDYPQHVVVVPQRDRTKHAPFTRLEFRR